MEGQTLQHVNMDLPAYKNDRHITIESVDGALDRNGAAALQLTTG